MFMPEETEKMKVSAQLIQEKHPYVNFSMYLTKWLSDFTEHVYQSKIIIVNRLYVDAPLNRIRGNYHLPKLEKLVMDLIVNEPLILPVGVSKVKAIITNVRGKYNLNYSTLLRYAKKDMPKKTGILRAKRTVYV